MILRKASKLQKFITAAISITFFLFVWYMGTNGTELGKLIPTPITVIQTFLIAFIKPIGPCVMLGHMGITLSRYLVGFLSAVVLGITLGLTMGWYPRVEALFRPIYEMIRPVPILAWIPISIIWFGLGETPKYFLVFLGALMSIVQNAYAGAKSVDRSIVNASKMLGASDLQLFFTVVIPSSVPIIFAGLNTGSAVGWASVVGAEMIRADSGVGWLVMTGQSMQNMTQMLVGIIAIAIIGFIIAVIMRKMERELCIWNYRQR